MQSFIQGNYSVFVNTKFGSLELVDDRQYSFNSTDNLRSYPNSFFLSENKFQPSSIHGVLLDGKPLAVFGDSGGGSIIHSQSAIIIENKVFLAIGQHVVCFLILPFELLWVKIIDDSTCFGLHYNKPTDTIISHGELAISEFALDGSILWQKYGADIFSGELRLLKDYIEVYDFNNIRYKFRYSRGKKV